ncbi:hypothetical protein AKJ16_DCAP20850 [Drosera capensis]
MEGLFDKQADLYVDARPDYPKQWYKWLADRTNVHSLAWETARPLSRGAFGIRHTEEAVIRWGLGDVTAVVCCHNCSEKGVDLLHDEIVQELESAWGGSESIRPVVYKPFMLAGELRSLDPTNIRAIESETT